jgi:hypothetical protein
MMCSASPEPPVKNGSGAVSADMNDNGRRVDLKAIDFYEDILYFCENRIFVRAGYAGWLQSEHLKNAAWSGLRI